MRAEDTARALRAIGRPALAAIVEKEGDTALDAHAARLHVHTPVVPLEPALAAAFREELARRGCAASTVEAALGDLERRRVLQTATHVTASEGPIFLAMHRLATLGLDPQIPYLVGACSGIPFSNDAAPGCLNVGRRYALSAVIEPGSPAHRARARARAAAEREAPSDHRISMIPWAMRDASVFHAALPAATREVRASLRPGVRALVPEAPAGDRFVPWALTTAAAILERCLSRGAVYLDLNVVVARYLETALDDGRHPLHRLLFDTTTRRRVLGALPSMPLFTAARGPRGTFEPLHEGGDCLRGPHGDRPLAPAPVLAALRDGQLCPGVYLVFAALALQNGFRCFGGVDQVEYLPLLRDAAASAGFATPSGDVAACALTTGRTVDDRGEAIHALDVILGTPLPPLDGLTLHGFLNPQLPRLLRRPFPG
jgi:hypothetical protein